MKHLLALLVGFIAMTLMGLIAWLVAYKSEWINLSMSIFILLAIAYMIGIKVIEELKK